MNIATSILKHTNFLLSLFFVTFSQPRIALYKNLFPATKHFSFSGTGCKTSVGWIAQDEYISTGSQHSDDAELLMVLTIPEFTKEKNEFKIEFSIHCPSDKCRFKIELVSKFLSI